MPTDDAGFDAAGSGDNETTYPSDDSTGGSGDDDGTHPSDSTTDEGDHGIEHRDGPTVPEDSAEASDGPSLSGIVGAEPDDEEVRPSLEPESIDFENALFVLVGALGALFVLVRLVMIST